MIKIRLNGTDVTIKKVKVTLSKNIRDILTKYMGSRAAGVSIFKLEFKMENKEFVIAEIGSERFEFILFKNDIPRFSKSYINAQILNCMHYDFTPDEARECLPLIYSLEEVPEDSNEETGDTSQEEAETSET